MEKGPSEYSKYWTSDYNELYHFYAHADEFGYVLMTKLLRIIHQDPMGNTLRTYF